MALTKDQILSHALGINLFLTRGNNIVKVLMVDGNQSYNYFTVVRLTGPKEDRNYEGIYSLNDDGQYFTSSNKSDNDIVALVTAEDLEKLIKADKQPTSKPEFNIDLDKCIKDHTPLRTRDGRKALVLCVGPNDVYRYKGVLIGQGGRVDNTSWTKDGVYYEGEVCGADIVGLWEETDGR